MGSPLVAGVPRCGLLGRHYWDAGFAGNRPLATNR